MEKVTQTYISLAAANAARQAEWPGVEKIDLAFRGLELAGEAGEACNIMKKLERQRRGIQGSTSSLAALGQELSDVVISAYLCAFTAGIDLDAHIPYKFNQTSEAQGLSTRLKAHDTPTVWRPISEADKSLATILPGEGIQILNSYPVWVRDDDGRAYEAVWSTNGKKSYWWDLDGESPVDPVEFMPHPLDPRYSFKPNLFLMEVAP